MKISLLSDIHLELHANPQKMYRSLLEKTSKANVMILAGDIGNPRSPVYNNFIQEVAHAYKHVIVIAGNHEYYSKGNNREGSTDSEILQTYNKRYTIEETDEHLRLLNKLTNVYFLQRDELLIEDVRFLGCTLWTPSDPNLSRFINDYHLIPDMTPGKCDEMYNQNISWLEKKLTEKSERYRKTVTITHHLPSFRLNSDKFKNNKYNIFYASNLDHLVEKSDYWLSGHTHAFNKMLIGRCQSYINPIGYSSERTDYDVNLTFDI